MNIVYLLLGALLVILGEAVLLGALVAYEWIQERFFIADWPDDFPDEIEITTTGPVHKVPDPSVN